MQVVGVEQAMLVRSPFGVLVEAPAVRNRWEIGIPAGARWVGASGTHFATVVSVTAAHEIEQAIALRAGRQHGLVTLNQLRELGLTADAIRHRVERGLLVRVGRGLFRLPGAPVTWGQRLLAAYVANLPKAVVSHFAAARLLELDIDCHERVDITLPVGRPGSRSAGVTLHWSRSFGQRETFERGLLRVTTIPRTLVDLAAVVSPDCLMTALDDVIVRRLCRPQELIATLDLPGNRVRSGTGKLRAGLAIWGSDSKLGSVAEAQLLRLLDRAGIPHPVCQYTVRDGNFVASIDFAWPNEQVAVEMDGFRYHSSPRAQAHDQAREKVLRRLGWLVIHTTPYELQNSPDTLLADLRDQLASRSQHVDGVSGQMSG